MPPPARIFTLCALPAVLATTVNCAAGATLAFDRDYKTVVADELLRPYITSLFFPQFTGAGGGALTSPRKITGNEQRSAFTATTFRLDSAWEEWKFGRLQAWFALTAGGTWYAGNTPALTGTGNSAGNHAADAGNASVTTALPDDRIAGGSASFNWTTGYRLRRWRGTTFALVMGLGAQYCENSFRYRSAESRAAAGELTEGLRDWCAGAITNLTALSVTQDIPLTPAFFDEPEDSPRSPRLSLTLTAANINIYGAGSTHKQNRFVNSFLWTAGAELRLPVAEFGEHLWACSPFFRFNSTHDDGNRAISLDRSFYRLGARIECADISGIFAGDGGEGDRRVAALKGVAVRPPAVTLEISVLWGSDFHGFQTGVGIVF